MRFQSCFGELRCGCFAVCETVALPFACGAKPFALQERLFAVCELTNWTRMVVF